MRQLYLLIFIGLYAGNCFGQLFPVDQKSPQSTLYKHYYYLSDGNYNPAIAAQCFGSSTKEDQELAIWLRQILDGKGLVPKFAQFPTEDDYTDSISSKHEFHPFPRYPAISVEKKGSRWYFSAGTKEYIPELHQQIFPFGAGWLMKLFPVQGSKVVLGLKTWQWFGVAFLLLTGLIVHKLFTWIIERVTRRLIQSTSVSKEFRIAIHRMAIPLSYLFLVLLLDWLFPSLLLPTGPSRLVNLVFRIMEPVFLTVALYRLADVVALMLQRRASKTETSLDDQLVPLFRKFIKVVLVIFGIVYLLHNLDFNLTALIAGVSIGGLALALAAQDTIKNMFGSLMIFVDKPFHIGDLVTLEGVTGEVEEVGFRSTRIRTAASSIVSIPNGKVVDMVVDNLGGRKYRRFLTHLTLAPGTSPGQLETFIKQVREMIAAHPLVKQEGLEVTLHDISNSNLVIYLNMHFETSVFSEELRSRQEILLSILNIAQTLEINFATPPIATR